MSWCNYSLASHLQRKEIFAMNPSVIHSAPTAQKETTQRMAELLIRSTVHGLGFKCCKDKSCFVLQFPGAKAAEEILL